MRVFLALALALVCQTAPGQTDPDQTGTAGSEAGPSATFDHGSCPPLGGGVVCRRAVELSLAPGQPFLIHINNTYPRDYDFVVGRVERTQSEVTRQEAGRSYVKGDTTLSEVYDSRYAGYVVEVRPKPGLTPPLAPATFVVSVRERRWELGFAGGFTANGLSGSAFGLEVETTGEGEGATTVSRLVEDEDRDDDLQRGIASFIHAWHSTSPVAVSFGLGLDRDRSQDYYLGLSYLLGDKAFITVGGVLGQVSRLPAGTDLGDVITDPNFLTSLPTRTALAPFVSISYGFIGGGEANLQKPFAQPVVTPPSPPTTSGQAVTGPQPAGSVVLEPVAPPTSAAPGATLRITVRATVDGVPQRGVEVEWSADNTAGTVQPLDQSTTDEGLASATWVVGSAPGQQEVKARVMREGQEVASAPFTVMVADDP